MGISLWDGSRDPLTSRKRRKARDPEEQNTEHTFLVRGSGIGWWGVREGLDRGRDTPTDPP